MEEDLKETDTILAVSQAAKAGRSLESHRRRIRMTQLISVGVLAVFILTPILLPLFSQDSAYADEALEQIDSIALQEVQEFEVSSDETVPVQKRDNYKSEMTRTAPSSSGFSINLGPLPKASSADAARAQAYAHQLVLAKGWTEADYSCLVRLWQRESGWRYTAHNKSSGAYGIPQALPGSKMKSAGADWQTNPETQVRWGLGYIKGRYGTPCGAWSFFQNRGWY